MRFYIYVHAHIYVPKLPNLPIFNTNTSEFLCVWTQLDHWPVREKQRIASRVLTRTLPRFETSGSFVFTLRRDSGRVLFDKTQRCLCFSVSQRCRRLRSSAFSCEFYSVCGVGFLRILRSTTSPPPKKKKSSQNFFVFTLAIFQPLPSPVP